MKHRLEVSGEVREVDATLEGETLTLTGGEGGALEVTFRLLPDGRIQLDSEGRTDCAVTARDGATTWVFVDGRAWKIGDADRTPRRRARGGKDDLGDVTPPMPAVVVGVLVGPGDTVTKGQRLVVVSAMKMETALVSPHDGTVAEVRCEVGAKVAPGDILVDITPDGPRNEDPEGELNDR